MRVLIVGVGVIGTVYGAQLAAAGHEVSVMARARRASEVAEMGLVAEDVLTGGIVSGSASVVGEAARPAYDIAIVAVRREQLALAAVSLKALTGHPTVLVLGNNPDGYSALGRLDCEVVLGFPGIGGTLDAGVARYGRIRQQPTALEGRTNQILSELQKSLVSREFPVQRIGDMQGWLVHHAVFIACIAAALERCGVDSQRLGRDRPALLLMCRAISEGFSALRREGIGGRPTNLGLLHTRWLLPVAVWYWSRTMRTSEGELFFAGHTRHASEEMATLRMDVRKRFLGAHRTSSLAQLLG